jgi:cobalt-zinc-cadmium efflux system protein
MNSAHDKHGTAPPAYNKAFGFGIALNAAYIVVQVIVGLAIQSMALLADAGHNTADILSLGLAWGASHLGQRKPSRRRTYGLRRTSILASLANAIILLIATGAIGLESARRFAHPHSVPGGTRSSRTGGLMTGC